MDPMEVFKPKNFFLFGGVSYCPQATGTVIPFYTHVTVQRLLKPPKKKFVNRE
jgi:hypothetical protein